MFAINTHMLYKTTWCISKYFENNQGRIFSITNIHENRLIFDKITVKSTDRFMVLLTWMHPLQWFVNAFDFLNKLKINPYQFYLMCNTSEQLNDSISAGFKNSYFINRHFIIALSNYNIEYVQKKYDVCIFGEQFDRNKIPYTFHIPNLAIIDGWARWNSGWKYPETVYRNSIEDIDPIVPADALFIQRVMKESYTGICLATSESICFSSMEFFLNGIPVISTYNNTGRMEWYNKRNSIIIDNIKSQTITDAVQEMKKRVMSGEFDSHTIREDAIALSKMYRRTFVKMTSDILKSMNDEDISGPLFRMKYENRFLYQSNWKDFESTLKLFD